jgi:ADP-ribose pyrophosphatase YjhB (NUDIX family)
MTIPKIFGKLTYVLAYPACRLMLYNSSRSYAALIYKDEILLIRNWLGTQKKWHLPGGGIENSESPSQAVIRELNEELGILVDEDKLIPLHENAFRAKSSYNYYLFKTILSKKPKLKINKLEIIEAKWISRNDISGCSLNQSSQRILELIGWIN